MKLFRTALFVVVSAIGFSASAVPISGSVFGGGVGDFADNSVGYEFNLGFALLGTDDFANANLPALVSVSSDGSSWGIGSFTFTTVQTLVNEIANGQLQIFFSGVMTGAGFDPTNMVLSVTTTGRTYSFQAVPEPIVLGLLSIGLAGLVLVRRRVGSTA